MANDFVDLCVYLIKLITLNWVMVFYFQFEGIRSVDFFSAYHTNYSNLDVFCFKTYRLIYSDAIRIVKNNKNWF